MKPSPLVYLLLIINLLFWFATSVMAQEPGSKPSIQATPTPEPSPQATDGEIIPQIVGGNLAGPAEYPWQVALVNAGMSNPWSGQFCGGSLIDPRWVVTAAHCVVDGGGAIRLPASLDVVLGINNLSDGPTAGSLGQRLDVAQVIVHSAYTPSAEDFDIALLRLANPATLNATVDTIGLISPGNSLLAAPGVTATVTGWGATSEGDDGSNALLEVQVPIVSNETCNAPASYNGQITDNMLCAGFAAGGKDSCQGDSGGPLIVPDGQGGFLLAGIVSWGEGCARQNKYGVYTRVSQFESWVNARISSGPMRFAYLPIITKSPGSSTGCTSPGESSNISNALTVSSGQTVCGQVADPADLDDVYKIFVSAGQQITISMNGAGGDADLFLYPPGSTDIYANLPAASSENPNNNEFIQITATTSGFWYVDIFAFSGSTNYNVTTTIN
jgi:secreted trypsin-like serine protease